VSVSKYIGSAVAGALVSGLVVFLIACGPSRSSLIKESDFPPHCKMELECYYFNHKSEAKGSCSVTHGTRCGKALDYVLCENRLARLGTTIDKRLAASEFRECMARMQ